MSQTNRSDHSPHLRKALIDAGVDLFNQNGYHATGVQDVCNAAGVTKGSFYYYFSSKDELLLQIHDEFVDQVLDRFQTIIAERLSPPDSIRELLRSMMHGLVVSGPRVTIFEQEWRHLIKDQFERVRIKRDEISLIVASEVQRGIDMGMFNHVPPRIVAFALLGMSGWAHRWYRLDGELDSDSIADIWSDMVLDGLRAPTR